MSESSEVKYFCICFWLHNQILTEVQIIEYRQKKLSFFLTLQGLYFFTQILFLQTTLILAVHTTAFMQDFPQRFIPYFRDTSENLIMRDLFKLEVSPSSKPHSKPTSQWMLFLACPELLTLLYTLCLTLSSPRCFLRATRMGSVDWESMRGWVERYSWETERLQWR